jgi:hypothetical protein
MKVYVAPQDYLRDTIWVRIRLLSLGTAVRTDITTFDSCQSRRMYVFRHGIPSYYFRCDHVQANIYRTIKVFVAGALSSSLFQRDCQLDRRHHNILRIRNQGSTSYRKGSTLSNPSLLPRVRVAINIFASHDGVGGTV